MTDFTPPPIHLEAAVRTLVGKDSARLLSWQRTAVDWHVVSEVTGGLHRLSGTWTDGTGEGEVKPWSLIIKANRRPPELPVAAEAEWRREEWAYTSGLLQPRDGFTLARLLGVSHPSDDETWLWLEDVPDEGGALWVLERHTAAARHLGVFNGSHLVHPSEAPKWLLEGWLEELQPFASGQAAAALRRDEVWRHPLVRLAFPESVLNQLEHLAQAAPALREDFGTPPWSLCHLDAGQFNMSSRTRQDGELETVLLDWQALSSGPLGADLAMMNTLNLCRLYVHPEEARHYSEATFAAYLKGLREGGAAVDAEAVYRCFSALAALRAGAIVEVLVRALVEHPERQTLVAQWGARQDLGRNEALRAWGRNMRMLLELV